MYIRHSMLSTQKSIDKPDAFAPVCSVVVCTRDRPTELDQCLEALAHLTYPHFDVLVVDNAPSDSRARQLAARRGVRYVIEPVAGLSRARNRGARTCDAEIVAYIDDDAAPEPGWLSALACEFADPLVTAVTGRVLPLGIEREEDRLFAVIGGACFGGEERRAVDRQTPFWFELANFGGIGLGMNMAFRRAAFGMWQGFDERLGRGAILYGCEEHHAFFSLLDRGYRIVYTPAAVVRHPSPPTLQRVREHHLNALAASVAYTTRLFFEEPRYRRATLRYVVEALRGAPRTWRAETLPSRSRVVSPWWNLFALLLGILVYFRSRIKSVSSVRSV